MLEFSLDGGANYETAVSDASGTVTYGSLAAGTYDLYVRWGDDGDCPTELPDVTLEVQLEPVLDLGPDQNLCIGQSLTLSAAITDGTAPFTYAWSTGETTATIVVSPLVTTSYDLTITDALGCQDNDQVTINVDELPVANDDDGSACPESESITIDLFGNDQNTQFLTSISISQTPNNGTVGISSDGTAVYSPDIGFCGTDQFSYEICINDCCSEANSFL